MTDRLLFNRGASRVRPAARVGFRLAERRAMNILNGIALTSSMNGKSWSSTGKPVALSSTLVGRNPEQAPPAKAGARVEGLLT
jgi:hypothetical protein